MDKDDMRKRVLEEVDYIRSPKFGNSLMRFKLKNQEPQENAQIAKLLMLSGEEEVEKLYAEAVEMLKEGMIDE